jgi:putative drug exporter of the RND superfamily
MMLGLARWTMAHRRLVVLGWIVLALAITGISSSVGSKVAGDFTLPGTGSQRAVDLLKDRFPAQAGDADQIVFRARTGKLTDARERATVGATLARVARLPHVTGVVSPYDTSAKAISHDARTGFATVTFDERANALPKAAVDRVVTTAQSARSPALQVELGGQAVQQAQRASLGFATVVGLAAAILILLISFGSFTAMGLPIVTAVIGLGAGIGVTALASHLIDVPDFGSELALMIGLGVGVDYALFIVTRFREHYRTSGGDVDASIEAAMNTAGRAVLFAGATVVIALLGMFALGVSILNGAAVAAAIAVVMVLVASLTLLPALLRVAGRRIGATGSRRDASTREERPAFWLRWVTRVQRRPLLAATAATALMVALAVPALGIREASSDAGNDPAGNTTRKAYDLIAQGFGPGFNGPLQVVVKLPSRGDRTVLAKLDARLHATRGIASVEPPQLNPARDTAAIVAYPSTSPQSAQTADLVAHLRSSVAPPIERATGASVYVGGTTASQADFSHVLSSKLPVFIAVVIALSALLLLVVFRSVVIPLQAAAMNLLSIGASLGVVQLIFQRGWLGGVFATQAGPIDAFIPVFVFAIVFGLSMDYEVFLVSRVHEEWKARGDASAAVREGLARTGRVITAAAAVMIAVFGAFAISGTRVLEMFGLGMASAVLLDAVVIRMILLPAVLELLGRRTWAFPRSLDRRLPRLAIEPEPENALAVRREPALAGSR